MLILQTGAAPENLSFTWLFIKMLVAMVVIISLALVSIRYLLPRLTRLPGRRDSKIRVLDFHPLEARKSVYILDIDNHRVAVGVTEHSINKLTEWPAGAAGAFSGKKTSE
jgi:flagellar biogenesis protein FliO